MALKQTNYESVDELIESQTARKDDLMQVVSIIGDQKYLQEYIHEAFNIIDNIKQNIKVLKNERNKCNETLSQMEGCQKSADEVLSRITYIENNLPNQFRKEMRFNGTIENDSIINDSVGVTPLPLSKKSLNFGDSFTFSAQKAPMKNPGIQQISLNEFQDIPSYMRGRTTQDKLNSFIDIVNICIKEKYDFINTTKADKQKKNIWKKGVSEKFANYIKDEKTANIKGKKFITQEDLKLTMNGKLDKQTLNLITMLRHTRRLEINRNSGVMSYIAMCDDMYCK